MVVVVVDLVVDMVGIELLRELITEASATASSSRYPASSETLWFENGWFLPALEAECMIPLS